MQDKITIATSSGVSGELMHASLDTKNQILRSHRPVSFVLTNGTVKANALTFHSAEHTLTFRGKVACPHRQAQKGGEAGQGRARAAQDAPPPQKAGAAGAQVDLPPMPAREACRRADATGEVCRRCRGSAPSVP